MGTLKSSLKLLAYSLIENSLTIGVKFKVNVKKCDRGSCFCCFFYLRTARPKEYYRKYLEQEVRPDGRELSEFRHTVLNIGCVTTAEGSALVKLGNTTIMCGIKAELAKPKTETPKCGFIVPNVELSPLCSPHFRSGPPGEQAQVMSQFMLEVINHSQCVDLESLCVSPGKLVWVLYCDLLCLDYDGNITDACVLALLAALKNVCLPAVSINEETEIPETDLTKKSSLPISSQPVSSTYAIFDDNILFVDPTAGEENLATGMVTIVTTDDKLCLVHKPGGSPLRPEQFTNCIERSFDRSKEICRLIDETLHSIDR